jgi:carboxymethylenebutenolidase
MKGTEVRIPGGVRLTPAYAALPAGARRGVVVIHEIMGRQPEIDRVVERFADAGYAAAAPDLLADGPRPLCISKIVLASATGAGRPVEQTVATRRWLCAQTGLGEDKVGLIGFCLGGGFVLGIGRGWGAVSTNYGTIPPADRLRGLGPTIGCYGGRDRAFARLAPKLDRALDAARVPHEVHVFPGAGHSFLTDGEHPVAARLTRALLNVAYDAEVAEQAWQRIFAFFDKHLPA